MMYLLNVNWFVIWLFNAKKTDVVFWDAKGSFALPCLRSAWVPSQRWYALSFPCSMAWGTNASPPNTRPVFRDATDAPIMALLYGCTCILGPEPVWRSSQLPGRSDAISSTLWQAVAMMT